MSIFLNKRLWNCDLRLSAYPCKRFPATVFGRFFLRMFLFSFFLLDAFAFGEVRAAAPPPPVGFIWHYPFVDVGTEQVPHSGASVMMSRAVWAAIQTSDTQFDFKTLDQQITQAERGHFKLVLLLECNPFCTPAWLAEKIKAAGECVVGVDGKAVGMGSSGPIPQTGSPIFQHTQAQFIRAVLDHVKTVDTQRVITSYLGGIEWWFPPEYRYAAPDLAAFRAWLEKKYGSVTVLNQVWTAHYSSFADAAAPRYDTPDFYQKKRTGWEKLHSLDNQERTYGNADAAYYDWTWFWNETAANYINRVAHLIKTNDPSRQRAIFLSYTFAFPAEWDYTQWAAISPDEVARQAHDVDVIGMQLTSANGDPYRISAGLDVARKYGKPMYDMDLLDFVAGVHIGYGPMEKATQTAIQHGASGLFYCCWNGAPDFNFYPDWKLDDLHRMLTDGRKAIALVQGMHVQPKAALVMPILPASPNDARGFKNNPASFIGWYKLLQGLHQSVDVVTLHELENGTATLDRYQWVLVPDCAYVSQTVIAKFTAYRHQGGHLIISGRFAQYDPMGQARNKSLLLQDAAPTAWPDFGSSYTGPVIRDNFAGNTPPMILWRPETAAYVRVRQQAASAFDRFLQGAHLPQDIELIAASPQVSCTVYEGLGSRAVYLVNMATGQAQGLRLRVKTISPVKVRAFADTQLVPCKSTPHRAWIEVALPAFRTSCIVKLTTTAAKTVFARNH